MKLDYKQFDFAETLHEIDATLSPESEEMIPMKQFISNKNGIDCAYAGVIAVCVRLYLYDNCDFASLSKAYDIVRRMLLYIFRSNIDCIDIFCMGRYYGGIYNAPLKSNIDSLIETMSMINAALSVLNIKLNKRFNIKVKGNCGCDYGELFRIQTSQNSNVPAGIDGGQNDKPDNIKVQADKVITSWHGSPLNMAIMYSNQDLKNDKNGIIISETIKSNLKKSYADFFEELNTEIRGYWASLVNSEMFQWVKSNK